MKIILEIGDNNTGKTTRIHGVAKSLEDYISTHADAYEFVKKPTRPLSKKEDGQISRKYEIRNKRTRKTVVVTFESEGDSEERVKKSINNTEDKKSDIHVMASRQDFWKDEWLPKREHTLTKHKSVDINENETEIDKIAKSIIKEITTITTNKASRSTRT